MPMITDLGDIDGPLLVFGGPYGNLQATEALLAMAERLKIPPHHIICTGDVVAYCGDAAPTVAAIRRSGMHVVMGNCEQSLAEDKADCGCGFDPGSACDVLSRQWFSQARQAIGADDKSWMARLPRTLTLTMNGRKLAVIHGGGRNLSRYVFRSTPAEEKKQELDALDVEGVIAGHCGLPFTEVIGGRLWHNAGVIGVPANDGTPRTWYSVFRPGADGIDITLHPLKYDHRTAAARMADQGLPEAYARTLENGLWPNMDILPSRERALRGRPATAETVIW